MTVHHMGAPLAPGETYDHVMCQIGSAERMATPMDRAKLLADMVPAFVMLINSPATTDAVIYLFIGGYDDDPREIWQISEAVDYLRDFAKHTGLRDWTSPEFARLEASTKALLIQIGAIAKGHGIQVHYRRRA